MFDCCASRCQTGELVLVAGVAISIRCFDAQKALLHVNWFLSPLFTGRPLYHVRIERVDEHPSEVSETGQMPEEVPCLRLLLPCGSRTLTT